MDDWYTSPNIKSQSLYVSCTYCWISYSQSAICASVLTINPAEAAAAGAKTLAQSEPVLPRALVRRQVLTNLVAD